MPVLTIASTFSRGRCFIAGEDLSPGELVHEESPLAWYLSHDDPHLDPIEKSLLSHFPLGVSPLSCILGYRLSLQMSHLKINSQVMSLCCHQAHMNTKQSEGIRECAEILHRMNPSVSILHAIEILRRISLNAFMITDTTLQAIGIGLYLRASLFNHSCDPNATQSFIFDGNSYRLRVYANRSIAKGEEIHISYIDLTYPNWWRRQQLWRSYGFFCNCSRCGNNCDGVRLRCARNDCKWGILDTSCGTVTLYRQWLRGQVTPPSIPIDTSQLPIAFPCAKGETCNLEFRCLTCRSPSNAKEMMRLLKQVSKLYFQCQSEEASLERYSAAVKTLEIALFDDDLALLRLKSDFVTELILRQRFEQAKIVMESYIPALGLACLPSNQFYYVQLYQLSKLRAYAGDSQKGLGEIKETVDRLTKMLGSSHPLVQEAVSGNSF